MSHFDQLAVRAPQQSTSEVTAAGIVGLFVQGFQTGLVVSQLAQWLNLKRKESTSMIALVAFVTVIGLLVYLNLCFRLSAQLFVHFAHVGWRRAYPSRRRGRITFAILDNR